MILSDVLGLPAYDADGTRVGRVVDARFRLEGNGNPSAARLVGLVVSPRSASSFLGYERRSFDRPVLLAALLRWMHRGSFLVEWGQVQRIDDDRVTLRAGFERLDSRLEAD